MTAPPDGAEFIDHVVPVTLVVTALLDSACTAPPVSEAVLLWKVLFAVSLVNVPDVRYMAPPTPSVASLVRKTQPAVSITVALCTLIPPPLITILLVKVQLVEIGMSVAVQTPPPMPEA
jgi:hypothetical protein